MAEDDRIPEDDVMLAETPDEGGRPDDRIDDERMDEENTLKREFVSSVEDALEAGETGAVYDLVEPLHPADVADLLELFEKDERHQLATAITDLMTSEVVAELNDYVREEMMEALPADAVAQIAEQLETDDAVQLIEDLDEDDQKAILAELDPEDRTAIETALAYPEETAGRLMSREFVAVPEHITVGDLIDFLREERDLPGDFFEVFFSSFEPALFVFFISACFFEDLDFGVGARRCEPFPPLPFPPLPFPLFPSLSFL